jgi:NAD(P)-dependent dehydrogenase (short-subunit alcohol dehydrogenase family)
VTRPFRCLVFGGSGALGGAVCRAIADEGARLAFTYRSGEKAALDLAKELPGSLVRPLDLLSVKDVERTVDEVARALGGLDAFVQCAGVAVTMECAGPKSHHRMPEVDEGGWDRIMAVNAKSTFFAVRRVSEAMRAGGGGNIVFIGSVDGVKPAPSPVHYAASKGALAGMTQAMAKELGEAGIRVNMVSPGILEGGLSRSLPDGLLKEYLKHCGLRRVGRLSEVAAIVAWLARHNTYVTGRVLLADGAL